MVTALCIALVTFVIVFLLFHEEEILLNRLGASALITFFMLLFIFPLYVTIFIEPKTKEIYKKQQQEYAEKRNVEIYNLGKASKLAGVSAEANPYNTTDDRAMWLKGYIDE